MISQAIALNKITLPHFNGERSMIPFDLATPQGLPDKFGAIARGMMEGMPPCSGTAYFTIHGSKLQAGTTLRRGGAHTDGNYEPHNMSFGGGGWKVGESGHPVGHPTHSRQYVKPTGGIILASNYSACEGWLGEYDDTPEKGGDCTHFKLNDSFKLESNTVYYGNNHFIHESVPVTSNTHRVFVRITLPEDHQFNPGGL